MRFARNFLPALIVLVVVLYETVVVPRFGPQGELPAHLAFYGLLGPLVTFFTIEWIAEGMRAREEAERALRHLYGELSASHEQLEAVQNLLRALADAEDLEAVMDVAVNGARGATGATAARLSVVGGLERRAHGALLPAVPATLHALELPLLGGGAPVGHMTLQFGAAPEADTVALAQALAAEIGTALESAQNRTRDLVTLYQVDQSIRAERNMSRLLERLTGTMAERVGAAARAAYLRDEDGVLRLVWARDLMGRTSLGGAVSAFARRVAEVGQPLTASPDEAGATFTGAQSALGLPMRSEEGLVGVIVLGDARADAFEDARIPLLALLASQATLAVRNARAYLYSEELAIGEERTRIAREIHDGVAQSLAFCAIKLDVAERQIAQNPERAQEEVRTARTILREQIREVRRSIFALRPIDLERFGLLETVRRYVQDFGEQHGVRTHLEVRGEVNLAPGDEAVMFRILQESLNNVAKHARAREVRVDLAGGGVVRLTVVDDGAGFDPAALTGRVSSAGGLGLTQMRERVESRGGGYSVTSAPGAGTRVVAELPQA
ncbi:GAF sensor signal transduction histidine kinase [Deinococcus maricopensis DSM 21211]|uniref:Oxygen sensor histidine kinase NreB n=1 Tax=Deinococcus maricopensis (strain DSM 21211 / LMG 22137 / NRRL B-23946 / LB-34) TaxID=709986 RepID=E8UAW9_DEIML|nr:GAF sensor signal transduction histidine kinase [Deinococcus maricopensis DSM 21211]